MKDDTSTPTGDGDSPDPFERAKPGAADLAAELKHTALLRDLAARLVTEESALAIYDEILSAAIAITESDAGTVQVYDHEAGSLELLVTRNIPRKMTDHFHTVDASSTTACGIALRTGERTFVDFNEHPADESCMMHVSAGLRSAQATPLRSRTGAPLGMLNTHWKESGYRPSDDQLRFLDLLARQAADLIEQRQAQESLRQSEEKYRTLFETIDEGFTIMEAVRDDAGRVVDVIYRQANQAWARLFGFEVELGRKASEVFSYPANAPWIETWNQVLETGEPVREEQYVVSTDRWYNVRFSRIGSAGSDLIAAVFDDITEQKRAELTLRESEAKLADDLRAAEALQALSSQLIKDGAAEEFFESILEVGMTIMQADFGSMQMLDPDANVLRLIAWRNFHPDAAKFWSTVSVATGTACGAALKHGQRVVIGDVGKDDHLTGTESLQYYGLCGITSVQSTPLTTRDGKVIGMISTHWRRQHVPETRQLRLLDILARQAADFIERTGAGRALRESEERLRNVLNSMSEGFALLGPDFTILDVNEETLRLDGRNRAELVGHSHWDAFPGTEDSELGQLYRQVAKDRIPAATEHRYLWPNGRNMWVDVRAYPTPDGGVAIFWRDITDRKEAVDALSESEERYRMLFESMDEAYAVVEVLKDDADKWADFRFLEVNPAFMEHTTMPYPVGKTATELLGTPNPRWTQLYGQALDTGQPFRIEESEATLGLTFDLNIFSLDRAKNRVAVLFTNITERKQAEAALRRSERHAQTLLAELQHRVRNTLAVVRSIARRTADNSTSVDDMLGHFQGRLNSFSRVQAALTRNPSPSINLASLIEDELAAHGARDGEQIGIAGPDIFLEPRTAEQLSLAIHELTTNAVKHGALVGDRGTLRIRWKKERLNGSEDLVLTWIESGVKLNGEGPSRQGFGMELLQRSLPYDLRAETEFDFRPDGLRFELRMPLREPAEVD